MESGRKGQKGSTRGDDETTAEASKDSTADASPLRDAKTPAPFDGAGDGSIGGPPKPSRDPALPPRAGYFVAPGKSLTSLRGILGPCEEVLPRDFIEGQKTLDHLVAYKYVIEQK